MKPPAPVLILGVLPPPFRNILRPSNNSAFFEIRFPNPELVIIFTPSKKYSKDKGIIIATNREKDIVFDETELIELI